MTWSSDNRSAWSPRSYRATNYTSAPCHLHHKQTTIRCSGCALLLSLQSDAPNGIHTEVRTAIQLNRSLHDPHGGLPDRAHLEILLLSVDLNRLGTLVFTTVDEDPRGREWKTKTAHSYLIILSFLSLQTPMRRLCLHLPLSFETLSLLTSYVTQIIKTKSSLDDRVKEQQNNNPSQDH